MVCDGVADRSKPSFHLSSDAVRLLLLLLLLLLPPLLVVIAVARTTTGQGPAAF